MIDYQQGKKLFESIDSNAKQLISVPNGGYNDLIDFKEYLDTIEESL